MTTSACGSIRFDSLMALPSNGRVKPIVDTVRDIIRNSPTIAIAVLGGWLFSLVDAPLPWRHPEHEVTDCRHLRHSTIPGTVPVPVLCWTVAACFAFVIASSATGTRYYRSIGTASKKQNKKQKGGIVTLILIF